MCSFRHDLLKTRSVSVFKRLVIQSVLIVYCTILIFGATPCKDTRVNLRIFEMLRQYIVFVGLLFLFFIFCSQNGLQDVVVGVCIYLCKLPKTYLLFIQIKLN